MHSHVRRWNNCHGCRAHIVERPYLPTYTARFGHPPWPLAVLLRPARTTHAIPLARTVSLPPLWGLSFGRFFLSTLSFGFALRGSALSTDTRLLDALPNTSLLLPVSTFRSLLSGGYPCIRIHLSRPIFLWHLIGTLYFLFPACHARYDAACFWELKDFIFPYTSFRVV
jgi:hypothetical protein